MGTKKKAKVAKERGITVSYTSEEIEQLFSYEGSWEDDAKALKKKVMAQLLKGVK